MARTQAQRDRARRHDAGALELSRYQNRRPWQQPSLSDYYQEQAEAGGYDPWAYTRETQERTEAFRAGAGARAGGRGRAGGTTMQNIGTSRPVAGRGAPRGPTTVTAAGGRGTGTLQDWQRRRVGYTPSGIRRKAPTRGQAGGFGDGGGDALESLISKLQSGVQKDRKAAQSMLDRAWATIEGMGVSPENRDALNAAVTALLNNPTLSDRDLANQIQAGFEDIGAQTQAQLGTLAAEGGPGARQKRWDIMESAAGAKTRYARETRLGFARERGAERRADVGQATQTAGFLSGADRDQVNAMLDAIGSRLDIGDYGRQVTGSAVEALTTYLASVDPEAAAQAVAQGAGYGGGGGRTSGIVRGGGIRGRITSGRSRSGIRSVRRA